MLSRGTLAICVADSSDGNTALAIAYTVVKMGAAVPALVQAGADVNAQNDRGRLFANARPNAATACIEQGPSTCCRVFFRSNGSRIGPGGP